jgi:hypothetical protein
MRFVSGLRPGRHDRATMSERVGRTRRLGWVTTATAGLGHAGGRAPPSARSAQGHAASARVFSVAVDVHAVAAVHKLRGHRRVLVHRRGLLDGAARRQLPHARAA